MINPKIWKGLWRVINSFWAIPSLAFLFILSKFIQLRIIRLFSERIGHFLAESMQSYFLLKDKNPDETVLFWFYEPTANSFWSRVVKRNLPVYQWINHLFFWNVRLGLNLTLFQTNPHLIHRDTNGNLERQLGFNFLPHENDFAKNWLMKKGWKEGEPFVCLLVRDSKYLETIKVSPVVSSDFYVSDMSYHSYRDSNIDDYLPAIKWLLEKEVWIVRMGKEMRKQVSIENKRLIDYPFCEDQDDLMDVWLFANCSLCISTLCGADFISDVYRRPLLLINFLPLIDLLSWSNTMLAPKKLLWANAGKELTLIEYLQNGFVKTQQYDEAGIKVKNLTPDDIYQIVEECWSNLEGDNQIPFSKNQGDFWRIFKNEISNNPKLAGFHRWFHPKLRMSEYWLNSKSTNFLS